MIVITWVISQQFGVWSVGTFCGVMFTLGFGVRSFVVNTESDYKIFGLFTPEPIDLLLLDWVGLAGLIAFTAGMFLTPKHWRRDRAPLPTYDHIDRLRYSRKWGFYLIATFAALGIQMTGLALISGGVQHAIQIFAQRTIANFSSVGFIGAICVEMWSLTIPFALISLVCAFRSKVYTYSAISGLVLVLLMVWAATINGRAAAIIIPWAAIICVNEMTSSRIRGYWLLLGLPGAAVVAVVGLAFRVAAQQHIPFDVALGTASGKAIYNTSDSLPMLDAAWIGLEYVRIQGHNVFNTVVAPFTVLVPRAFWAEKPIFAPQLFSEAVTHAPTGGGLPAGVVGEGYVAFGWAGMLLFCGLMGAAAAAFDREIIKRRAGELLAAWLVFEATVAVLMGIRVGFQGLLITCQLALIWLPLLWGTQSYIGHLLSPKYQRARRWRA